MDGRRGFAAPAASFFLDGQKEAKEPPRGLLRGAPFRCSKSPPTPTPSVAARHLPPDRGSRPWTPIYGSPIRQQLRLSQRRGGTLIDRVSISAAAPFLVAVRWYFYQQTARLLAWWGPSCAVGHAFCHHWSVGSENRGAEVKTQHRKFSTLPGPRWGRVESQGTTQISTRRKVIAAVKGWPP